MVEKLPNSVAKAARSAAFALWASWPFCNSAFASTDYQAVRLPLSDLLPHAYAQGLRLDNSGALWISTESGLHRYNGNRIEKLYSFRSTGYRGNPFLVISSIVQDPQGGIWLVHTNEGLQKYDSSVGAFELFSSDADDLQLRGLHVSSIHHDGQRTLWLAQEDGKVIAIDTVNQELRLPIPSAHALAKQDYITAFLTTSNGRLFMASSLGTLFNCNDRGQNCSHIQLSEKFGLGDPLGIRHMASNGSQIYIGTHNRGAFLYEPKDHRIEKLILSRGDDHGNKTDYITDIVSAGELGVWIGTQAGLFLYGSDGSFINVSPDNSDLASPVIHSIEAIEKDRVLISTVGGVYLVEESLFEDFSTQQGLRSNLITTLERYGQDKIFVGTYEGLDIFDIKSASINRAENQIDDISMPDPRVTSIYHKDGVSWFGFFEDGLYKFNHRSKTLVRLDNPIRNISSVSDIIELEGELLAIATQNSGLHIVDMQKDKVLSMVNADVAEEHTPNRPVFTLESLQDGSVLAGAVGGLYKVQLERDRETFQIISMSQQLGGVDVLDIYQSSNGVIWIGTNGRGIYRWETPREFSSQNLQPFETSPSIPTYTIYAIEEDDLGLIWLATNNGLVRLNPITAETTIFDTTDGLLDNDFNLHASFKDKNGSLYFGGFFGFNRIDPAKFVIQRNPPPIRLTKISMSNMRLPFDPLYEEMPLLTLRHSNHSVDFEFGTMDILSPGRSQYKYMLIGFDSDWIDNGNRNSATFTNLPAGEYVFRVIGANSNGVWNYAGVSLPIKVLPAPWLTWWAITFYCLSVIAIIALIKRYYDARLLNREATKQVKLMTNTAMLAMDDLEEQLLNERQLISNLRTHSSQALDSVDALIAADAQHIIDEQASRSLEKARGRLKSLKAVESAIYFFGEQLKVNFHDAVDRFFADMLDDEPPSSCEVVLANDVTEELLHVDLATTLMLIAYEIVQNSFKHAFSQSEGIQCIHVKLETPRAGESWLLEISDTGQGLADGVDPLNPDSQGMKTIARLVRDLGGSYSVNTEKGTVFTIRFPANQTGS